MGITEQLDLTHEPGIETHGIGSVGHDFNTELNDTDLLGTFDLVTDFGLAGQVFNIPEVFRTIHRLCRPGGVMIFWEPVRGGASYFHLLPELFEDLAAMNAYEIVFSGFEINGDLTNIGTNIDRHLLAGTDIGMIYVLRKIDVDDFVIAYQGETTRIGLDIAGFEQFHDGERQVRGYRPKKVAGIEQSVSLNEALGILTKQAFRLISRHVFRRR